MLRVHQRIIAQAPHGYVVLGQTSQKYRRQGIRDNGWQGKRTETGELMPNERFPDMKSLADYVHARGLTIGIYSSPGPLSCAGYEGSMGHEDIDGQNIREVGSGLPEI